MKYLETREDCAKAVLALVRIMLGVMLLWAFFDKMFGLGKLTPAGQGFIDGGSPSGMVVYTAGGIFKDFWMNFPSGLVFDIILLAGLLGLGICLVLGIASRLTTVGTFAFMVIMATLCLPPSDNLVGHQMVYAVLILVIYFCNGFEAYGLSKKWQKLPIVRDCPKILG